jgi:hypothetical protein
MSTVGRHVDKGCGILPSPTRQPPFFLNQDIFFVYQSDIQTLRQPSKGWKSQKTKKETTSWNFDASKLFGGNVNKQQRSS